MRNARVRMVSCWRIASVLSVIGGGSCGPVESQGANGVRPSVLPACRDARGSAVFRAQQAPPSTMLPGERAEASVSFDNCSGEVWRAGQFMLVPRPDLDAVWGVSHVLLPRDVPNGERVTIPLSVRAPNVAGQYSFSWVISRDGIETFQEPSQAVVVNVRSSADCSQPGPAARFREQTPMPAFAGPRERVRGAVTFANCGAETWTAGAGFSLVTALPMGRTHVETARVELPTDVPFGAEVTIRIEGTTPEVFGRYPYAWSIARDGALIGEPSPEQTVTVGQRHDCGTSGPSARFVAQNAPAELDPAQSAEVDVTFANCSDSLWDESYRLRPAAPAAEGRWGVGDVSLAAPIAPGFRGTMRFRITAPREAGAHAYRWAMTRAGAALDEATPPRTIQVRLGPGPCNVRPVDGVITSPFGYRIHPIYHDWRLHAGIDFDGDENVTPIRACRAGTVIQAGPRGTFGNAIEISHGGGMTTVYAHQHHFAPGIYVNAPIQGGQVIGVVGSTGAATGAHLHFEVRLNGTPVNPAPYLP